VLLWPDLGTQTNNQDDGRRKITSWAACVRIYFRWPWAHGLLFRDCDDSPALKYLPGKIKHTDLVSNSSAILGTDAVNVQDINEKWALGAPPHYDSLLAD